MGVRKRGLFNSPQNGSVNSPQSATVGALADAQADDVRLPAARRDHAWGRAANGSERPGWRGMGRVITAPPASAAPAARRRPRHGRDAGTPGLPAQPASGARSARAQASTTPSALALRW